MMAVKAAWFVSALIVQALGQSVTMAPLIAVDVNDMIADEYIVMLRDPTVEPSEDDDDAQDALLNGHLESAFSKKILTNDSIIHRYEMGYAVKLDNAAVNKLRQMPDVDFIEPNQAFQVDLKKSKKSKTEMKPVNWGLDRIDQRKLPLDKQYKYQANGGEGVDVYVIDTGIFTKHNEFEGRASVGKLYNHDGNDYYGHGTFVASVIAGKKYGVAKKAKIISVKVFAMSSGTTADVIAGVHWVTRAHRQKKKKLKTKKETKKVKSVANMSIGGRKSFFLYKAVEKSINAGVHYAIAAGNNNDNACNYSPSDIKPAVTVGAVDYSDTRSTFSNFGKCVDIVAPGEDITAAGIYSKTDTSTLSGTSMAAPFVAGVMALLAANHDYTPAEMKAKIIKMSTKGVVKQGGSQSPNRLLFIRK